MPRATNKHHLWWPKRDYTTDLERTFRELPCNIIELMVLVHDLIHLGEPPPKPTPAEMVKVIRKHEFGLCPCKVIGLESERRRRRTPINDTTGRKRHA